MRASLPEPRSASIYAVEYFKHESDQQVDGYADYVAICQVAPRRRTTTARDHGSLRRAPWRAPRCRSCRRLLRCGGERARLECRRNRRRRGDGRLGYVESRRALAPRLAGVDRGRRSLRGGHDVGLHRAFARSARRDREGTRAASTRRHPGPQYRGHRLPRRSLLGDALAPPDAPPSQLLLRRIDPQAAARAEWVRCPLDEAPVFVVLGRPRRLQARQDDPATPDGSPRLADRDLPGWTNRDPRQPVRHRHRDRPHPADEGSRSLRRLRRERDVRQCRPTACAPKNWR